MDKLFSRNCYVELEKFHHVINFGRLTTIGVYAKK